MKPFSSRPAARIVSLTLALMLVCVCLSPVASAATPSRGDLIHFVPTTIDISYSCITVVGYFVNLNTDCEISNFRDFEMNVYHNGDLIVTGDFGTLSPVTVAPLGVQKHTLNFNGTYPNMEYGSFVCTDTYYCSFSCTFSYVSK